ncbi:Oidioi.mRNA.OKI2018_I69.PAR.g10757.t1.cds [Oikopleura dioica]|uniref:Oidioi.mRNA.OKI2018_I69.PAR.g10757.t1.cds n=1 Tax=Oikopleura dioica TaxID=34765 RepID=A0ABN7RVS5_OIKDI|nr:Oidioi.mRNA.OKI2018_I69.PAR.g10757.t1.cds [Oikopleura dioica]
MSSMRELATMSAQRYLLLRDQTPHVFGYNLQNEDYKLRKEGGDGKVNVKAIIIAMASTEPGSARILWTEKRIPARVTGNPVEDHVAQKWTNDQRARMLLKYLWMVPAGDGNDPDRSDIYYLHHL